ncbi:MAG TPA: HU family DNA-binding protein [Solirubrobacteraceae bacterium]|jgi:DNA-binding protein HU-beta|nr:HU family DNA-binding protein [Solirubrobacteraceae bacterium]
MTKAEFTEHLAERASLSRHDAARSVEAMLEILQDTLRRGGEVRFSGFGRFHVGERGGRAGVNPRTGERIDIEAVRIPRFTAGSALKKAIRDR